MCCPARSRTYASRFDPAQPEAASRAMRASAIIKTRAPKDVFTTNAPLFIINTIESMLDKGRRPPRPALSSAREPHPEGRRLGDDQAARLVAGGPVRLLHRAHARGRPK